MLNEHSTDVRLHQLLVEHAELLHQKGAHEPALELITALASLESKEYIGYLSSIRLEQLLAAMGADLFPEAKYANKKEQQRHVLHIGTEFYNIGGHTKVALDWIANDEQSQSELLIIHQTQEVTLPASIPTHYLKGDTLLERATALRQFLEQDYYDVIVLHQHMEDVVPTLALWDIKTATDSLVLFYNHANFRFSLGNIIAHKRVNICEGDVVVSKKYRYPVQDEVLSFILGEVLPPTLPPANLMDYRKELGINTKQTIFFSIGSAYKYTPFDGENFLDEWNTFLHDHPDSVMIIVGCDDRDFQRYCPDSIPSERLLLLGRVIDPTRYYQIADYIVDIYPLQTGLGTLNGLYYGLAPILPYKETAMVLGKEMNKLYPRVIEEYLSYTTREAYFAFLEQELTTRSYQQWAAPLIKKYVEEKLLLKPWQEQLERLYAIPPEPAKTIISYNDVLNTSVPSQRWYAFTYTPTRSFHFMVLLFAYNVPLSWTLLRTYARLVIQHQSWKGAGLKAFLNYLFKKF